jgi:small subunit ribosomal protein S20
MPNTKQAKKRVLTTEKARVRNKARRSVMRTSIKKVQKNIEASDKAAALADLRGAYKQLDKAAMKRVIHPNAAARKKSQLARRIAALSS